MSSNGAVGGPEDMQVESAHENSLKHLDAVVGDKPTTHSNNIADISGKHMSDMLVGSTLVTFLWDFDIRY